MSNILIYNINEPYVHQGGMERVTDSLIRLLQERGHRVSILCRYRNRMNAPYSCPCDIYYLPKGGNFARYYDALLRQLQPDIVIDQEEGGIFGAHGIFPSRQKQQKRPVYIAVQHSSAASALRHYTRFRHKNIPNALLSMLYNGLVLKLMQHRAILLKRRDFSQLVRNYDCIVTLSPSAIREFRELCPQQARLTAIANCTHYPQPTAIPGKKKQILYVGRMENQSKGVDRLIRIWARIEDDFPEWELHLLGEGPDLPGNMDLAEQLGLTRYRFHGCCDPEAFYRESAVICLTSTYEGFGMVLLEGMQYGCVPVAFDSYPAVHDLIEHRCNGLLVPAFDEKAYARSLSSLLRQPQLLQQLSKEAQLKASRFSPEQIGNQWQQLISELLNNQAS